MRVLVACEFSGVVRDAFLREGHDAWSCDLLPSDSPLGPHIQGDVLSVLEAGWDLMVAHPPCTYISNMSNCRIKQPGRLEKRKEGMEFFMRLTDTNIPKVVIENPRGAPEREWRRADQIIQPYQFGHPASKATCLWLKGLPLLVPTKEVKPTRKWDGKRFRTWVDSFSSNSAHLRSVTFQGVAEAMAKQWGRVD
jgi:hypothetical protein